MTTLAIQRQGGGALAILLSETRMEFLRLLRAPAFSVPVITFPLLFYVLFGVVMVPHNAGEPVLRQIFANFTVFGVMAPGLFGLGVTLAIERDRGLLQLKRALPLPPSAYLGAKLLMAMSFSAIVSLLLMVIAVTVGQVVLALTQWLTLFALAVVGALPFCGLGLLIGTLVKGQAAPALINLIYLPMSFLSGVLIPLQALPHALAVAAPIWPCYHLSQLAQAAVGGTSASGVATHILALIGMASVLFGIALRRWARLR